MELLPPHTEPQGGQAYDLDAFAQALTDQPKEDTSAQWEKEPEPAPEPPPADTPGSDGPKAEPNGNAEASAREFIECYDILQSWSFSIYSQGMAPEKFQLASFPKERAIHHLAKGLEKMGTPELPWWVGLVLALAPAGFMNYMAAREYRNAAADAAMAKRNAERSKRSEAVHADTITMPNGSTVPAPEHTTAAPPKPTKMRAVKGTCEECNGPVYHTGRKYCGQSCSAKALNRRKSAAQ